MTCTFFGHRDAPEEIYDKLMDTIINLIKKENVTNFYVGDKGNFDIMVKNILKKLSGTYPIKYNVALSCMPKENDNYKDYSDTILPEGIETVFPKFAISYRNRWMIEKSDFVITYVKNTFGGAYQFKTIAEKKGKIIINLLDNF